MIDPLSKLIWGSPAPTPPPQKNAVNGRRETIFSYRKNHAEEGKILLK